MDYKKLQELRNTYPSDSDNIPNSFTSDNTTIKYSGLYPEPEIYNFIEFDIVKFDGVSGAKLETSDFLSEDFRFIIQFNDGDTSEQYTSVKFKKDLEDAILEPNPYFNKLTVTIAIVDLTELKNYWKSRKFDIPEKYAEVRITDTMTTKEDMLKHINWITTAGGVDEELREVDTFGAWSLYTGETDLGFQYSDDIDNLDNGELEGDDIVTKETELQLRPFENSGRFVGEVRVYESSTYVWSGIGWVLK